jgi:hypothetical protein
MSRWLLFNLSAGQSAGRELITSRTLAEIHAPQVVARTDPAAPTPTATYAMGWFVDTYNGRARLTHGGYLDDINSEVMLFPEDGIGIVAFTNFGFPSLARLICQHAFDALMGLKPVQSLQERIDLYESKILQVRERDKTLGRVDGTAPSHALAHYAGAYVNPGYGEIDIQQRNGELLCRRGDLEFLLQHWHFDAWIARDIGMFVLHAPHPFDRASQLIFETNNDGYIAAFSMRLEPAVVPIRFIKTNGSVR